MQYTYLDEDGFQESGAGGLNLIVDDRQTDSLLSELGLRIARIIQTKSFNLIPELSLAWSYDYDIDDRLIKASFAGAPGNSFSIAGQDVKKNGAIIGVGITLTPDNSFTFSLMYSGEFREEFDAHGIILEFRFEF